MKQDMIASTARLAKACFAMQLFALLALAGFRSDKMVIFAYDLPPGPTSERVIAAVETWNGWMEAAGMTAVTQTVLGGVGYLHGGNDDL